MAKLFRVMKGDPVDPRFLRYPVAVFPKFNGFRGYIKNGVVYTASNKPFKNKELQARFVRRDFEDLDGEFVVGDPADGHNSLEKTSSIVTSQKPIDDLRFYAFDWIGDLNMPFGERYEKLKKLVSMEGRKCFKVMKAPFEIAHNWEDVLRIEHKYVALGWEGVITRDLLAPYKCGRSTAREAYMGKLKQFSDAEFEIIGYEERMHNGNEATVSETGRTKRSTAKAGKTGRGDLGALICKTKEGHEFGVGTGFTDEQRAQFWGVKHQLIGQFAKVKFHETGTKDVPLLPVFLQIRPKEDMTK
jgi:DNA ligase-1